MAVSPRISEGSAKTTKEIREWAIGEGREVSPRGRISAEIVQAFHDAQATKAQAKVVPAKKTATKEAPAKKTAVEKVVEKEAPVKGAAAGTTPAKKTATKKTATKKTAAKKTSAAKAVEKAAAGKAAGEVTAVEKVVEKEAPVKVVEKEAPVKGMVAGTAPAKKTAKEIREWAIGEGREVSFRGRISAAIVRAFHDAAAKLPVVGG